MSYSKKDFEDFMQNYGENRENQDRLVGISSDARVEKNRDDLDTIKTFVEQNAQI